MFGFLKDKLKKAVNKFTKDIEEEIEEEVIETPKKDKISKKNAEKKEKVIKAPSMLDALIPIFTLVFLLASALYLYGSDGTAGPIQVALMLSMMVADG